MASLFYKFVSINKSETLYLNKDQICSISEIGFNAGDGTAIKMTNNQIYMVNHTAEQVLTILSQEPK